MSCSIKRILTIDNPVKFRSIQLWDEQGNDITETSMYSWSTDSLCWTNWVDLNTYNSIGPNIEGDYYLRILIMNGFSKIAYDNAYIDCYNLCLYNQNPYTLNLCDTTTNVDFYCNLDCAIQMQQQLSDLICCRIGIPAYYFRVTPTDETKDLTFKEYVLHNVTDMKIIKLVTEDGQMPSSKPQMTEFDFDWENDWEVECSKTAFATAFGDTAFPKQRDILYVPMMKRMYEVNAAYDEKQEGFMWRATTWKLALVKWNEKTNVDQGAFEDIIDNWAVNQVVDLLPNERIEQERESGTTQTEAPTYAAMNLTDIFLQDAIRKQVNTDEKDHIIELQLNHGSAIVARNAYDFKSEDAIITYQKPWCGENGTLLILFEFNTPQKNKTIFHTGYIDLNIDTNDNLSFGSMTCRLVPGEAYIISCQWNRNTFSQSLNVYHYIFNGQSSVPLYKRRPEMYQFDFDNPVCELTTAYNNDYITTTPQQIVFSPAPCKATNIRLYDIALDNESTLRESIKYSTSNEHCVFNDVARPIEAPYGYSVR